MKYIMADNENIQMQVEETPIIEEVSPVKEQPAPQRQVSLTQIPVNTENDALNMLVAFLQVAQKRGAFSLEEAGKIMESVNFFQKNQQAQQAQLPTVEEEK